MDNYKEIKSMSLIHFLTNQTECYIKLKNLTTGLYLNIDILEKNNEFLEKKACGKKEGTILILTPTYLLSKCYFKIHIPINLDVQKNFYLTSTHDSAIIKKTYEKMNDNLFYLDGTIDKTYIIANQNDKNMFGENGRYVYMTDDGMIYVNGDQSINSSLWKIEKINEYKKYNDSRTDYKMKYDIVEKESKRNMNTLFSQIIKYFTFFNVKSKKYLNISINNEQTFEYKLFSSNEKMNFTIRPVPNENCVYISYYIRGKYVNIYVIPQTSEVLAGAPDCDWAKFYIIKKNNYYLFQSYHKECDINGEFGKYLCMKEENNEIKIMCDGCVCDDLTKWTCEYITALN
jgi:hypothetical protein